MDDEGLDELEPLEVAVRGVGLDPGDLGLADHDPLQAVEDEDDRVVAVDLAPIDVPVLHDDRIAPGRGPERREHHREDSEPSRAWHDWVSLHGRRADAPRVNPAADEHPQSLRGNETAPRTSILTPRTAGSSRRRERARPTRPVSMRRRLVRAALAPPGVEPPPRRRRKSRQAEFRRPDRRDSRAEMKVLRLGPPAPPRADRLMDLTDWGCEGGIRAVGTAPRGADRVGLASGIGGVDRDAEGADQVPLRPVQPAPGSLVLQGGLGGVLPALRRGIDRPRGGRPPRSPRDPEPEAIPSILTSLVLDRLDPLADLRPEDIRVEPGLPEPARTRREPRPIERAPARSPEPPAPQPPAPTSSLVITPEALAGPPIEAQPRPDEAVLPPIQTEPVAILPARPPDPGRVTSPCPARSSRPGRSSCSWRWGWPSRRACWRGISSGGSADGLAGSFQGRDSGPGGHPGRRRSENRTME